MSNKSSVEWLYQEFERIDKEFHVGSHEYNYAKNLAFKISKAMHKEEIIDAHGVQYDYSYSQIDPKKVTGEQYYNETYGY